MTINKHFIETLGYEIELTSRVCHETFKRWFEQNCTNLTIEEFVIIDTIDCKENLSQIELANIILKGKAHTGKFLDSLESKGYIKRLYDTKKSRMVKIPVMTDEGKKIYQEIRKKFEPIYLKMQEIFPEIESNRTIESLKKLRNALNVSFN